MPRYARQAVRRVLLSCRSRCKEVIRDAPMVPPVKDVPVSFAAAHAMIIAPTRRGAPLTRHYHAMCCAALARGTMPEGQSRTCRGVRGEALCRCARGAR